MYKRWRRRNLLLSMKNLIKLMIKLETSICGLIVDLQIQIEVRKFAIISLKLVKKISMVGNGGVLMVWKLVYILMLFQKVICFNLHYKHFKKWKERKKETRL